MDIINDVVTKFCSLDLEKRIDIYREFEDDYRKKNDKTKMFESLCCKIENKEYFDKISTSFKEKIEENPKFINQLRSELGQVLDEAKDKQFNKMLEGLKDELVDEHTFINLALEDKKEKSNKLNNLILEIKILFRYDLDKMYLELNNQMYYEKLLLKIDRLKKIYYDEVLNDLLLKQKSFKENTRELNELKNNLFNFFGLIVGLLAFVFTNTQFVKSASELGLGKLIVFLGISNISLLMGIFFIMTMLSNILNKGEDAKLIMDKIRFKWLGIISFIILVSGGTIEGINQYGKKYRIIDEETISLIKDEIEVLKLKEKDDMIYVKKDDWEELIKTNERIENFEKRLTTTELYDKEKLIIVVPETQEAVLEKKVKRDDVKS